MLEPTREGLGAGPAPRTTLFDALIPSLEQVGAAVSAGFFVIDLAVQVSPEKVVEKILEHEPDIVGFSAFMPMFEADINVLQKAGLRDQVIAWSRPTPRSDVACSMMWNSLTTLRNRSSFRAAEIR
ncbi:cobalamin-dependent protein [Pseudonocardia xinjiangensis]|uniref:B12-binding domain-containing protein n=1 Tax=Pseudonocardia xinjiangensis TaxID=75289 RepID=A0ABX1R5T5_9PSEU|nr:cobalamin-dependent protein [Pseudonocardia xinjiangensis]NMH75753.1 hypothetical protein [Pseudonocardia xinjiangensis]